MFELAEMIKIARESSEANYEDVNNMIEFPQKLNKKQRQETFKLIGDFLRKNGFEVYIGSKEIQCSMKEASASFMMGNGEHKVTFSLIEPPSKTIINVNMHLWMCGKRRHIKDLMEKLIRLVQEEN